MSFTSAAFYGFFALVYAVYYVVPPRWQNWVTLAACLWFAAAAGPASLAVLCAVALLCRWYAPWLDTASGRVRRRRQALGVALVLGVLVVVKYSGMLWGTAAWLWPSLAGRTAFSDLVQVLGVSYYSLTAIAYLVEVGRGKQAPLHKLLPLLLSLGFFPAFLSGPIGRVEQLCPQFAQPRPFVYENFALGLTYMLVGAFKKLVIADGLALIVDPAFTKPDAYCGPLLILAAVAFALQLYYDFSGYTDMARGAALAMGIQLRQNFRRPFAAHSFSTLWNRWHLSLSEWFRDYVYIPLGGSRHGMVRMCLATMAVFALSGLWHEAGWLFLLWGMLNGVFVLADKLTTVPRTALAKRIPGYQGSVVQAVWQRFWVLAIFAFCFTIFRVGENTGAGLRDCLHYYAGMARGWGDLLAFDRLIPQLRSLSIGRKLVLYLGGSLLLNEWLDLLAARQKQETAVWLRARRPAGRLALVYVLALLVLFFGQLGTSSFIYFKF